MRKGGRLMRMSSSRCGCVTACPISASELVDRSS
jgi:hypothetical protein